MSTKHHFGCVSEERAGGMKKYFVEISHPSKKISKTNVKRTKTFAEKSSFYE